MLAVALAGCGSTSEVSSPAALDVCLGKQAEVALAWGRVDRLAGAYAVTAGELADWQETRHRARGIAPTSQWRDAPAGLPVHVCYFDGDFDNFPGKGQRPIYDRLAVIVGNDGALILDSAGPQSALEVERPAGR
ncbi:MAG: hypothetical protein ACRDM0_03920 [Thermoleophilaceae bacterium]